MMRENRTVYLILGYLLAALSVGMVFPLLADILTDSQDWKSFLASASLTAFIAVLLILTNRGPMPPLGLRQAFLLTNFSWLALTLFSALPFILSQVGLDFTDAFFEAMSGLTTTGATVLLGLDNMNKGILLWRAMLNWFGGVGIIVMAIAVLPMLNIGGMQLFRTESSDTSEKILPRTQQITGSILRLYLSLSFFCALSYVFAGMSLFDAVAHSMTTVSTGGFSTHDASIGYFSSNLINAVAIFFIILSSVPYLSLFQLVAGRPSQFFKNSQIQSFLSIFALSSLVLIAFAQTNDGLSYIIFNGISVLSGTGFAASDYNGWGPIATATFFFIALIGGCTGSATGGIKVFRLQVALMTTQRYLRQLAVPRGVFPLRYNGKLLSDDVAAGIVSLTLVFFLSFTLLALALSFIGLDMITSVSAAAAAIANVGPGLGEIVGPSGNYSSLPDSAKWLLSAGMLLGRLEFFTVLVMLLPSFWRRG
jgi:trk system potassium uptake protein TrkH